jgi:hypothetical protein
MESTAAGMEVDSAPRGAATTQNASAEQALSLPWVEKYRPNQLSDLCSHEEIISTLNKLMSGGRPEQGRHPPFSRAPNKCTATR